MQQKDYRDDITIIPNKVCLQLPYYIGTVKKKKKREKKKEEFLELRQGKYHIVSLESGLLLQKCFDFP